MCVCVSVCVCVCSYKWLKELSVLDGNTSNHLTVCKRMIDIK